MKVTVVDILCTFNSIRLHTVVITNKPIPVEIVQLSDGSICAVSRLVVVDVDFMTQVVVTSPHG